MSVAFSTVRQFGADHCSMLAAAISYRVLFSVIPLTALLVSGFGWTLRVPEIEQRVIDHMLQLVPLQESLVSDAIREVGRATPSLTVIGAVLLLWAASGMFGTMRESLNLVFGVKGRGAARGRLVDVSAVLGLVLLLGLSILATVFLSTLEGWSMNLLAGDSQRIEFVWKLAAWIVPGSITFVALLLVYRFVPNADISWRHLWPGAVLSAVLLEIAKHGFAYYVAHFNRYEILHGALGAVLLFQLWVYISANVLLLGAELDSVLATPPEGKALAKTGEEQGPGLRSTRRS